MIIKTPEQETLHIIRITHDFTGEFGLPDGNNVIDKPLAKNDTIYCRNIEKRDGGSHFLLSGIDTDMGEVDLILCPEDFTLLGKRRQTAETVFIRSRTPDEDFFSHPAIIAICKAMTLDEDLHIQNGDVPEPCNLNTLLARIEYTYEKYDNNVSMTVTEKAFIKEYPDILENPFYAQVQAMSRKYGGLTSIDYFLRK